MKKLKRSEMTELGGEGRGVWEIKKKVFSATKS